MSFRDEGHDPWDEEFDPEEVSQDSDGDDETDEEPTVACPYCGELIYEDAPRCPHCDHYISDEDRPPAGQPWWIIIGALAVMYAIYRWTAG